MRWSLVAVALGGCAILGIATFDSGEYALINEVHSLAEIGDCSQEAREDLWKTSLRLKNYAAGLHNNVRVFALTSDLHLMIGEFKNRKNPSPLFCTENFKLIKQSAEKIQKVIGDKPQ